MRPLRALALAFLSILAAFACTERASISDITRPAALRFTPSYTILGSSVFDPITQIRLTARVVGTEEVVATKLEQVSPDDPEWSVSFDVAPDVGTIVVLMELLDAGGEVEWSGLTAPIVVTMSGPNTAQPIVLFQGPAGNITVTGVSAGPDTTVVEGATFSARSTLAGGGPGARAIFSALDPEIAEVSATGTITTKRNGAARIVVVAGPAADTMLVTVLQRVASVVLTPDTQRVSSVGAEAAFSARVLDPRGAQIAGAGVVWSASSGVAEHLGNGRFRATANGSTQIFATSTANPALRATGVFVVTQRAARLDVTPPSASLSALGAQQPFNAVVQDANGNAMSLAVQWRSSNGQVATINAAGVATATGIGVTEISAIVNAGTPDSIVGRAQLQVTQAVHVVQVTPTDAAVLIGAAPVQFRAAARDANNNEIANVAITWSVSDTSLASIDANGFAQGKRPGRVTITGASGSASGTAVLIVSGVPDLLVQSLTTMPADTFIHGDSVAITLVVRNAGTAAAVASTGAFQLIDAATGAVVFAATFPVAALEASATVTLGRKVVVAGTLDSVRVRVALDSLNQVAESNEGNNSATTAVHPISSPVAGIQITPAADTLLIGDSVRVVVVVRDRRGNAIPDASFEIVSGNPAVASVDPNTLVVRAHSPGDTYIVVRTGIYADTLDLDVVAPNLLVKTLNVIPADTIREGDSATVVVTLRNGGSAAAPVSLTQAAVIDAATGAVVLDTVIATPMLPAFQEITVVLRVAVDTLTTWPDSVKARITADFGATIAESNEADNVAHSTSRFVRRLVTGLDIADSDVELAIGDTAQLAAVPHDRSGHPLPERPVAWVSRNESIATVNASGRVTATGAGSTYVVATSEGISDSVRVSVTGLPDLLVQAMTVSPADSVVAADSVTVTLGVRNAGTVPAGPSQAVVQIVDAATGAIIAQLGVAVPLLQPHESALLTRTIGTDGVNADSVRLRVVLDSLNEIAESDETNNVSSTDALPTVSPVASIEITPVAHELLINDSLQIAVVVRDRRGNPIPDAPVAVTSGNPEVASVDQASLKVYAHSAGDTYIIASTGSIADTLSLEVVAPNLLVETLDVLPADTIAEGDSVTVVVTLRNGGSAPAPASLTEAAVIDAVHGTVVLDTVVPTPVLQPGEELTVSLRVLLDTTSLWPDSLKTRVTADFDNAIAESNEDDNQLESTARYVRHRVAGFVIQNDSIELNVGDTTMLSAVPHDRAERPLPDRRVVWTSLNPAVATVDSTGRVIAVSEGSAYITVTSEGVTDSMRVNVQPVPVPPGVTHTWLGHTTDYHAASNWSPATVPGASDVVWIRASAPNDPVLSANVGLSGILVDAGAVMNINNSILEVASSIRSAGVISAGSGYLSIVGSGTFEGTLPKTVVLAPWTASGRTIINGNVAVSNGSIAMGGHTVVVNGSFTLDSNATLTMANPQDSLNVRGSFYMNRYNGFIPTFSAGTLVVGGDFAIGANSSETFRATGSHTTVFDGGVPQHVYLAYGNDGRHYFNNLVVANADSVVFTNNVWVENHVRILNGIATGAVTAHIRNGIEDGASNRWRVATTRLFGSMPALPAGMITTLVFNSATTLQGDLALTGNVFVNDGSDFRLGGNTLTVSGNFTVDSNGAFQMTHPADDLIVNGAFYMNRYNGFVPEFSAGIIRARGAFAIGANSSETFRATGTHKVIIDGSVPQTVYLAYGGDQRHYFHDLELANPDSVIFSNHLWVQNKLVIAAGKAVGAVTAHVRDTLLDVVGDRWQVNSTRLFGPNPVIPHSVRTNLFFNSPVTLGSRVTVNGNVNVFDGADLRLAGHAFDVKGNFTVDSNGVLQMLNPLDSLIVAGNIYMNRYNGVIPQFTAGVIRTRGSFTVGANSSETFRATGTHKVILDGTGLQTVHLSYGNDARHYFYDLELHNPDSIRFDNHVWVDNKLTIGAGVARGNVIAHVRDTLFDAVGNKWQVANTRIFGPAPVIPAAVMTNMFFNTPVTLASNVAVTGNVSINDGADLRLGGHTMTVSGDFSLNSNGTFQMTNAADELAVAGNLYMNRYNGVVPEFSAGLMRVKGDFATGPNSSETFRATGSHTVLLEGTRLQNIHIAYGNDGRHYFHDLRVNNPDSVLFSNHLWINNKVEVLAGHVVGGSNVHVRDSLIAPANQWRPATTRLFGDSVFVPNSIKTNIYFDTPVTLRADLRLVGNTSINNGAVLRLGGRTLSMSGNFMLDSNGLIEMTAALDSLVVGGSVYMNRYNGVIPTFSAGVMRVSGDFGTGPNSSETFRATGTHKVVLAGASSNVALAYGADGRHYFNSVELLGSVAFANHAGIRGNMDVKGGAVGTVNAGIVVDIFNTLFVRAGGTVNINGVLKAASVDNQGTINGSVTPR